MTRTYCDVCEQPIAVGGVRVSVVAEPHPHDSRVVRETVDVCRECLRHVPDLTSEHTTDAIRRRRIAAKGGATISDA